MRCRARSTDDFGTYWSRERARKLNALPDLIVRSSDTVVLNTVVWIAVSVNVGRRIRIVDFQHSIYRSDEKSLVERWSRLTVAVLVEVRAVVDWRDYGP